MSSNLMLAIAMVLFAGAGFAIQAPINDALGNHVNSGIFAAMISFGIGFAALVFLNIATANFGSARALSSAPIWMFAGGLIGAFVVYTTLANVGKLGSLTLVVTFVFGQLLAALVIDAIGFGNLQIQAITPTRILAVLFVGAGIIMSRL